MTRSGDARAFAKSDDETPSVYATLGGSSCCGSSLLSFSSRPARRSAGICRSRAQASTPVRPGPASRRARGRRRARAPPRPGSYRSRAEAATTRTGKARVKYLFTLPKKAGSVTSQVNFRRWPPPARVVSTKRISDTQFRVTVTQDGPGRADIVSVTIEYYVSAEAGRVESTSPRMRPVGRRAEVRDRGDDDGGPGGAGWVRRLGRRSRPTPRRATPPGEQAQRGLREGALRRRPVRAGGARGPARSRRPPNRRRVVAAALGLRATLPAIDRNGDARDRALTADLRRRDRVRPRSGSAT